jgi:hypothetical protein
MFAAVMAVAILLVKPVAPSVTMAFVTDAAEMVVLPAGMVIPYSAFTASARRRASSPEARRREGHDRATITLLAATPDALAMPAATATSTPAFPVNAVQFATDIAKVPTTVVTVTDPGAAVVGAVVGGAVVGGAVVGGAVVGGAVVALASVVEEVALIVVVSVMFWAYVVEEVALIVVVSVMFCAVMFFEEVVLVVVVFVMFCAVMFFAVIDPRRANPRHIHIATWPDIPNTSAMDETETKPKD